MAVTLVSRSTFLPSMQCMTKSSDVYRQYLGRGPPCDCYLRCGFILSLKLPFVKVLKPDHCLIGGFCLSIVMFVQLMGQLKPRWTSVKTINSPMCLQCAASLQVQCIRKCPKDDHGHYLAIFLWSVIDCL